MYTNEKSLKSSWSRDTLVLKGLLCASERFPYYYYQLQIIHEFTCLSYTVDS